MAGRQAPAPRTVLKLGAALALAGLLFAAPYLLVPGLALLGLVLASPSVARLGALGSSVRRGPLPATVTEGQRFDVSDEIRGGWLPSWTELIDPAMPEPVRLRPMRPRSRAEVTSAGVELRRGRIELDPPRLRFADALGLAASEVEGDARRASVLVLPRIEPIVVPGGAGGSLGAEALGEAERARSAGRESPAELELEGVRPYREGAPASRIYWPALARTDELLERRFAHPGGSGPTVALDARDAPSAEALDRAVRAAASLAHHLGRTGGCELLLPGGTRTLTIDPSMAAWPHAHAELALVAPGESAPRLLPDRHVRVFWVTSGSLGPPPGMRGYLITPDLEPDRSVAFTVAGCAARPIGATRARRAAAA